MNPTTSTTVTFVPGKTGCPQRCGARVQIHQEHSLQGERLQPLRGTVNMLSSDYPNRRSPFLSLTGPLSSPTRSCHYCPRYEEQYKEAMCRDRHPYKRNRCRLPWNLRLQGMANLNCQINALSKMSRLSRQEANRNPPVLTSLENLAIPPSYMTNQGENMLMWDSSYTEERRRTLMFGSIDNINLLSQCDHLMLDGPFSSAPQLWQQLLSIHGLFDSGWHLPLVLRRPRFCTLRLSSSTKRRKWTTCDERLSSIVDDFDEYDPMDYLHCIGEMLFTS